MGYWQEKVVPKIKKVFEKSSVKKAAAAEACKSFDDSKEEYNKEFEEKKAELQAKVTELYEALSAEIKKLIKEPKHNLLKKYAAGVEKFLDDLSKLEFPGCKPVYEATTKYGATYVSGPIIYIFEKVSTYIPVEEKKEEEAAPPPEPKTEETSGTKEDVVPKEEEEEKKEEAPAPEAAAAAEPPKEEECAPAEPPKP